ncbi:hypothetical protein FRB99_001124 [Tulasnella sp. 403]|nr:hypothetical protein FRB99_001124 [Tulasnella sp. 403]
MLTNPNFSFGGRKTAPSGSGSYSSVHSESRNSRTSSTTSIRHLNGSPSPPSPAKATFPRLHSKHSLTPVVPNPNFSYSLTSSLANKRDSFGKNLVAASSSLKAELSTLLEEDEEDRIKDDDDDDRIVDADVLEPISAIVEEPETFAEIGSATVSTDAFVGDSVQGSGADAFGPASINGDWEVASTSTILAPTSSSSLGLTAPRTPTVIPASPAGSPRPRPPSLSLRPLSLVSALPTLNSNSATPSPNPSPRLKSLTLSTTLPAPQTTAPRNTNTVAARRQSVLMIGPLTPSPSPQASLPACSSSLMTQPRRKSSIGYRRTAQDQYTPVSAAPSVPKETTIRQSLPPTPGLTPTSAMTNRSASPSTPSDSISSSRASSEFFQNQAVASLLSRIAILEEALAAQSGKTVVALIEEEEEKMKAPTGKDELIVLITDLKAERDELNNDIAGWRTRCSDLTHAQQMLQRRLADERRELLVLQQRLSSLTSELNTSRVASEKIEEELVLQRAAVEYERRERKKVDDELNDERRDRIGMEMHFDKDRLAWQKERDGWETERQAWGVERRELGDSLTRADRTIAALKAEIEEKNRQIEKMRATPDAMMTPKARVPFTGAGARFAFPPPIPSAVVPPIGEGELLGGIPVSPPAVRPATSTGFGGFNPTFKFGGRRRSSSSVDLSSSHDSPLPQPVAEPPSEVSNVLNIVAEEDEEDALRHYEDEEDGDVSFSNEEDDEHPFDAIPAPTTLPPTPSVALSPSNSAFHSSPGVSASPANQHRHRRSISVMATWKFPSPNSMHRMAAKAASNTTKEKPDRFFACLEDEDDAQGSAKPFQLLGKSLKAKEHKKLPSGCPAFWLDCDEEETVVRRELPLPSPSITEESDVEDKAEVEANFRKGDLLRTNSSSPVPVPLVPRAVISSAASTPTPRTPAPKASLRVSLGRTSAHDTPSNTPKVAPPVFFPAAPTVSQPSTNVVPVPPPSPGPFTTIPPSPRPAMAVPPSINTTAFGSSDSITPNITPSKTSSSTSSITSYFAGGAPSITSRLQSLGSMIAWSPRSSKFFGGSSVAVESSDERRCASMTGSPAKSEVQSSASASSVAARPKHVDPSVARERLRRQLEREDQTSSTDSSYHRKLKRKLPRLPGPMTSQNQPIRILIVGAGAVGCFYGSRLHNLERNVLVSLICRSNYKTIVAAGGVEMQTTKYGDYMFKPEYVFPDVGSAVTPASAHRVNRFVDGEVGWDYLVITTKALPDVEDDSALIVPLVGAYPAAGIVLIQNGVGVEEPYRRRFGGDVPILSAVTVVSAEQVRSGVVRHNRWTRISVGPYTDGLGDADGEGSLGKQKTAEFVRLLKDGGIRDAEEYDEKSLQTVRWHKIAAVQSMRGVVIWERLNGIWALEGYPG